MKRRAKFFQSIPVEDWNQVIRFEKIIKNYMAMVEILEKNKLCQQK